MKSIHSIDELSPRMLSILSESVHRQEIGRVADDFLQKLKNAAEEGKRFQHTKLDLTASCVSDLTSSMITRCREKVMGVVEEYEREYGITIMSTFEIGYTEGPQSFRHLVREFICAVLNSEKGGKLLDMTDVVIDLEADLDHDPRFKWGIVDSVELRQSLIRKLVDQGLLYNWA